MVTSPEPKAHSAGQLLSLLACPADHARLISTEQALTCPQCARDFPIIDGIPVLAEGDETTTHDEIDHLVGHSDDHKRAQAAFFDEASAVEFEITRPHGTPGLYRWMLDEKLSRAVRGIEDVLPGATALVVCGGSGMDAEYLARSGANVISSDISLGAARRTAARARRYGLEITPIVADAERLPFRDRAIDVVTVHDGLHHLENPERALMEMARVADRAISVSEPAEAAVTALAVRLGLALEREEAGNRVNRLRLEDVAAVLRARGFAIVSAGRYAMYYRHVPGSLMRLLSSPPLVPIVRASIRMANLVAGKRGNKLSVVATRSD